MKRTLATFVVLFAAFGLGIVTQAHAINHKCSVSTLQGGYGYTATATLLPTSGAPPSFLGPFAEVGRQTFDGKGNTAATATLSANGNILKITATGTYTVNPDCTGTITVNVAPLGVTSHSDFVIDDDGAQIRTISTDQGVAVETRVYTRQFQGDGSQEW